jgi:hypothetical protein
MSAQPAWIDLSEAELDEAWTRFSREFDPRFGTTPEDWPGIVEPTPSATYDISSAWDDPDPFCREVQKGLNRSALAALRECTTPDESIYAFSVWRRYCAFHLHRVFKAEDPDEWAVPVLPVGGYGIFVARDMRFGIYGHPWESTVCVFGSELLSALAGHWPELFSKVVRRDGTAV